MPAHEFKTPLTSIRAATTSLLSSPDQPLESRTELLEIADEEARHLQALIDDAVDMARLESNHIQVRRELTDPRDAHGRRRSLRSGTRRLTTVPLRSIPDVSFFARCLNCRSTAGS